MDDRYADWAAEVGVPTQTSKPLTGSGKGSKDDLIAELDAVVALLYGLSEDQLIHIFATFHRGWDYQPRLESVLMHYHNWKGKQ